MNSLFLFCRLFLSLSCRKFRITKCWVGPIALPFRINRAARPTSLDGDFVDLSLLTPRGISLASRYYQSIMGVELSLDRFYAAIDGEQVTDRGSEELERVIPGINPDADSK